MDPPQRPDADLRRFLSQVWRRKWILLPIVVVIPLATYLISQGITKTYRTSTLVQVRDTGSVSSLFSGQISIGGGGAEETARLIPTGAVAREAARVLGEPAENAGALGATISARVDDAETGFVTITAEGENPGRVARVANAYAAAIGAKRTADATADIDQTINTLTKEAAGGDSASRVELAQQLQQLRALRASLNDATVVIEPAAAPGSPVSPNPRRNATLAFVLALLLAAGMVPLLEGLDRRLRNPDDLEEVAPVLAAIPAEAFPDGVDGVAVREAFQTLRAALTYFNIDRTVSKVMVGSPGRDEGKTTVATGLAVALAQDGRKVALLDADLRRPRIASRLGIADEVHFGLEEVVAGRRSINDAMVRLNVEGGQLLVLPSASPPPNPSVILGSERMRTLLAKLSEQIDIVILDTPPLLSVSDAIPLLEQVSGTLLIARMDQTSRDALRRANRLVASAGGNVLGTVATGVRLAGIYGYGYGYGYEPDAATNGSGGGRRSILGLRGGRRAGDSA